MHLSYETPFALGSGGEFQAKVGDDLVANFEGGEFAGGGADVGSLVADVIAESGADSFDERIEFLSGAFGDELDAAVREVADKASDFVVARDRMGCVAEANALDMASVVDGVAL